MDSIQKSHSEKERPTKMMPWAKRYRVIFSIWGHSLSDSISDYDTIDEVLEETKLLKEFYKDTPKPKKSEKYGSWDYSDGSSFWGYIVLDYVEQKILDIYRDGIRIYTPKISNSFGTIRTTWIPEVLGKSDRLRIMDIFFRDPSEIPENYNWDGPEEYKGWLRYRWGDGGNAVKPRPQVKKLGGSTRAEDDPMAEYDKMAEKELKQRKLDRW